MANNNANSATFTANAPAAPRKMRCLTKRWIGHVMLEPGDPYMLAPGRTFNPKTLQPWDEPVAAKPVAQKPERPPGAGPERRKSGPFGS